MYVLLYEFILGHLLLEEERKWETFQIEDKRSSLRDKQ